MHCGNIIYEHYAHNVIVSYILTRTTLSNFVKNNFDDKSFD